MTDPVQEARQKLIHIKYRLGDGTQPPVAKATLPDFPPQPPTTSNERYTSLANFLANVVGVQVKRAVTLGIGFLVGAGYLTATQGDAQAAALAAVLSQFALTLAYAAYDKFVKAYVLKLIGAPSASK